MGISICPLLKSILPPSTFYMYIAIPYTKWNILQHKILIGESFEASKLNNTLSHQPQHLLYINSPPKFSHATSCSLTSHSHYSVQRGMARNGLQCELIKPCQAGPRPAPQQQVGWLGLTHAGIQYECSTWVNDNKRLSNIINLFLVGT